MPITLRLGDRSTYLNGFDPNGGVTEDEFLANALPAYWGQDRNERRLDAELLDHALGRLRSEGGGTLIIDSPPPWRAELLPAPPAPELQALILNNRLIRGTVTLRGLKNSIAIVGQGNPLLYGIGGNGRMFELEIGETFFQARDFTLDMQDRMAVGLYVAPVLNDNLADRDDDDGGMAAAGAGPGGGAEHGGEGGGGEAFGLAPVVLGNVGRVVRPADLVKFVGGGQADPDLERNGIQAGGGNGDRHGLAEEAEEQRQFGEEADAVEEMVVRLGDREARVLLQNIQIRNARQLPGGMNASAIEIIGPYSLIEIVDCGIDRVTSAEAAFEHGARGISIHPDDAGGFSKRTAIRGGRIANVYHSRYVLGDRLANDPQGRRAKLDADGLYVNTFPDQVAGLRTTLDVSGVEFRDCQMRSIKGQVAGMTVRGCRFERTVRDGHIEVDAQFGGAILTGNTFYFHTMYPYAAVQSSMRAQNSLSSEFVATGNLFTYVKTRVRDLRGLRVPFQLTVEPAHEWEALPVQATRMVLQGNVVRGLVDKFAVFSTFVGASFTVVNNALYRCEDAFLLLTEHGLQDRGRATYSGIVANNTSTAVNATVGIRLGDRSRIEDIVWEGNRGLVPIDGVEGQGRQAD